MENELLETGMIRLIDLPFEAGRAKLLNSALHPLEVAGRVLVDWPDLRWEIGGHVDATRARTDNRQLSEARAIAVQYELLKRFPSLKKDQLSIRGYGGTRPLSTAKGSTAPPTNARIELKVLNPDVLKREVTRRRLLQNDPGAPGRKE
jgi:OOP family OmpA-OmpF porin